MGVTNHQSFKENAAQERLILEAAKDYAIFTTDLQRRVISWNAGAENLFGYTKAEMLGQLADILYVPEDRPDVPEREAEQAQTEGRAETERWHLCRDGSRIYGSGVITPLRDDTGTVVGLVKIVRDLTRQKQAEEALAASEKKFRTLFNFIDEGVSTIEVIVDEQGKAVNIRYLENNAAVKKILGIELTVGKTAREVIPELEEHWIEAIGNVARTGEPTRTEYRVESLDKWISAYFLRVGDPDNRNVVAVYADIIDRKRQEANLAFLAEVSLDLGGLTNIDETMNVLGAKIGAYFRVSACSFAEINAQGTKLNLSHDWHADDVPSIVGDYQLAEYMSDEAIATWYSGQPFIVSDTQTDGYIGAESYARLMIGSFITVPLVSDGEFRFILSIVDRNARNWRDDDINLMRELTNRIWTRLERARAEESLRQSEEKFRTLFETMEEGFAMCEGIRDETGKMVDYRIMLLNPAYERLTGGLGLKTEDALGKRALEIAPGLEDWWFETFQKVLDTGETIHFEHYLPHFSRWYEVTAFRYTNVSFAYLYNDVTGRKRRETNLAFLNEVSQNLASLTSIEETMSALGAKIGGYFNATRCAFFEFNEELDGAVCNHDWHQADAPSLVGSYRTSDFYTDEFLYTMRAGKTFVVNDRDADLRVNAANLAALDIASYIVIPIARNGQLQFALAVYNSGVRHWRNDETELLCELVARVWTQLERARAEESLRESQRFVQGIITSLPLVIYLFDLTKGKNLFLSPKIMDVFGYQPNEMQISVPNLLPNFFHPDDLPRITEYFEQINRSTGDDVFSIECRMKHRERGWIWVVCRDIVYARDAEGRPTQLLGTAEDITERKEAERTLRRSDERFRTLVQNLPDYAIFRIDPDTIVTEWTEGAQRVKGYTAEEAIGQPLSLFYTPENLAAGELTNEVEEATRNGRAERISVRVRKGGERFWVDEIMTAIHDETGQLAGFTKISRDITQRRQMEQALREADRRKDEFLALLAHELRNPLATLSNTLLILELTGGKTVDMNVPAATAMMTREVAQLTRLVDDLLDVSRISRGKLTLTFERLDLTTLVSQAGEAVRAQFLTANRRLSITLPPKPTYLNGDAARLRQVISNLLTNALKFTNEDGYVGLSLEQANGQAVLRVQDDGIGIPPHELTRIFEMFAQVDSSVGRSQGGLGLGLTLVSELVKLHEGRVEAYSAGEGSTFTVYLPLEVNQSNVIEQVKSESVPARKRQVLVVDDNHDAARTLAMLLKLLGNEVHTRHDGLSGVEAAESLRPQVAVFDISMPGMDGYQAAQRIREQPWGQHLMLIALSGYGQEEDKRRSREAGFDTHLVKPVDMAALNELLASLPLLK